METELIRMTMSAEPFEPDPEAMALAEDMMDADDTMQTILQETLQSSQDGRILESGRTTCGDERTLRGPLERFPTSVELQQCPVGLAGAWHTHVTPDELLHPQLSIPDMGNVVYGYMDVFIVAGAKSADVMVAAEDREAMREAYQNVLGIEASGVGEVVQALDDERIADPNNARQRLRERFAPLLITEETGYDEIADTIEQATDQMASDALVAAHPDRDLYNLGETASKAQSESEASEERGLSLLRDDGGEPPDDIQVRFIEAHNRRMKNRARNARVLAYQTTEGIDLKELVVSTIIGNVVGNLVDNYLMP